LPIGDIRPGQCNLHPDELRPLTLASLVEPVGIDQPWGVIVRVGANRSQESGFVTHAASIADADLLRQWERVLFSIG